MATDVNEHMQWRGHVWRRVERGKHSNLVTTNEQGQPGLHTSGDDLSFCLARGR